MEIRTIYVWICFIFCLGLITGGILVLFGHHKSKKLPSRQYLQYYLVLIYTFGLYALWSRIFFQVFFSSTLTPDENRIITNFLVVLGVPFLVTGYLMLVLWSKSLLKKQPGISLQIAASIIILLIVVLYITYRHFIILSNIRQLYAVFVISLTMVVVNTLVFSELDYVTKKQKIIFSLLFLFTGSIYTLLFFIESNSFVLELVFVFLFFLSNTSLVVYLTYSIQLTLKTEEVLISFSFHSFVEKYHITSREAEIAQHIYQGKTNQEIADKLFVTVQTIKDHTHRIYQKTEVKSRAQLTSLMRKFL